QTDALVKIKGEVGPVPGGQGRVVVLLPKDAQVHGHGALGDHLDGIPPKNGFKEVAVHIKIGQQVPPGLLTALLLTAEGIHFLFEIGFHPLLADQFVILLGGKDQGMVDIEVPDAPGIDVLVGKGIVGVFGNNAVGVPQEKASQFNPGLHGILGLSIGILPHQKTDGKQKDHKGNVLKTRWSKYWFCPSFQTSYKFLSACLIMFSTLREGSPVSTLSTTFSDCLLGKPRTSNADNASSLFVLFDLGESSPLVSTFK